MDMTENEIEIQPFQSYIMIMFQYFVKCILYSAIFSEFCHYKNKTYNKDQVWYDGCNFKCVCENPATNKYRCDDRLVDNFSLTKCIYGFPHPIPLNNKTNEKS